MYPVLSRLRTNAELRMARNDLQRSAAPGDFSTGFKRSVIALIVLGIRRIYAVGRCRPDRVAHNRIPLSRKPPKENCSISVTTAKPVTRSTAWAGTWGRISPTSTPRREKGRATSPPCWSTAPAACRTFT